MVILPTKNAGVGCYLVVPNFSMEAEPPKKNRQGIFAEPDAVTEVASQGLWLVEGCRFKSKFQRPVFLCFPV